jgi:hypothetical protein
LAGEWLGEEAEEDLDGEDLGFSPSSAAGEDLGFGLIEEEGFLSWVWLPEGADGFEKGFDSHAFVGEGGERSEFWGHIIMLLKCDFVNQRFVGSWEC